MELTRVDAKMHESLIREFYRSFNERKVERAVALFDADAIVEQPARRTHLQGGPAYLLFAQMWLTAFPDAQVAIDRVSLGTENTYEVDLTATGTHLGSLDLGGGGVFRPTGTAATLRLRHLLQFRDSKIVYSSLSFDFHEVVQQLVTVDVSLLLERLRRVQQLGDKLAATPADDLVERRIVLYRIGAELDDARHVVRPYFRR